MPGRDEEMKPPEEIQEMNGDQVGKAADSTPLSEIKQKLFNLRAQAENEIRKEIRRGFEEELEGLQKTIRTLRGEVSNFRTWMGNAIAELPADIYVIFRTKNHTNIEYSEAAEAIKILREQREELIRQKAWRDIEENSFNGTLEEPHSLTERPALNTVHEHDQRAEKDHETVSVLLSLINDACCMAQDARGNPEKLERVRAHVANVLPLKALGQKPKEEQPHLYPFYRLDEIKYLAKACREDNNRKEFTSCINGLLSMVLRLSSELEEQGKEAARV